MSTYNFTAFLEEDLLQGVNGTSIGAGDTFVMPAGATVEFSVTDDDGTLSGDAYNNEQGDDTSGQTADIVVNGQPVFDDVKIYAEQYHVLYGSDGQYYYLMEIEVAGSEDAPGEGDDFFTFWGWTPPAGVELSVVCTYNVTCDWMDYTCLIGGHLIVIQPENTAPEARDDALVTDENTTVTANLLANDSDADGDPISVTGIQGGTIGEAFEVKTANGLTGQVTVQSDGTFTFDPDDNFQSLAQGAQDSFDLTYTITDDPSAAVKHNLMFVLDISNSTVGTTGENVFDGVGVGDTNGDGIADTVLDAEIAAVLAAVQSLIDQGVDPANIDVGIATFSGVAAGFTSVDAETLGTFALNDGGLAAQLQSIQSGGWTNYEAGLQEAEDWFASQAGDGAKNKLVFLSDGRPIVGYDYDAGQYITQTNADYGDEVNRIANTYGADIHAIGVGANSDLEYLNELDNTGGAERVTDAATLNVVVENAVAQPASSTATVTVTINGLNAGPDAVDDTLTTTEDASASINILGNDTDPDGDLIQIVQVNGKAAGEVINVVTGEGRTGTVTYQTDGTLTFMPDQSFQNLNDGQSDTVTLNYSITDGQFTDDAQVTVLVNGSGSANGKVTLQGSIAANVSGQTHVVLVLDASFSAVSVASAATNLDLDGDGNVGTLLDGMITKIADLASDLNDNDLITLIPSGFDGMPDSAASFQFTAAQIKSAAINSGIATGTAQDSASLPDLLKPMTETYGAFDFMIDLPQGLQEAETVITAAGADKSQVLVLTTSDGPDQAASLAAQQSLVANTGAEIDIVFIDAGNFVDSSPLNAIDTDGSIDTDAAGFGLDTLVDQAASGLAPVESFSVLVGGVKVDRIDDSKLSVNADGTGYLYNGEIDLDGLSGEIEVLVALDTDLDESTAAEVFALSDTQSLMQRTVYDGDTFVFDFA